MARFPRYLPAGQPQHIVQRGNNRAPIFFVQSDYAFYLESLGVASSRYDCAVHVYVLMSNHVHLLVSPGSADALPRAMQSLGRRYAQHVNRRHRRTGTLWEGRYHASLIHSDDYFWTCSRYVELNPVRAGMVSGPEDYAWSSHAANAFGEPDRVVRPHALYELLGRTTAARCAAYRALFEFDLGPQQLHEIREAIQRNRPLGSDRFRHEVARTTGRAVAPSHGGRRTGAGRPPAQKNASAPGPLINK